MSEALSDFVHINLCCGMKHYQHLSTSFLLIQEQSNYYYTFEMSAAYFLVNVVVCYFHQLPIFILLFFSAVLQNIWNQPIPCFHLFGGLLDSTGYQLVVKH